jgi:hypothetical protein
MLKTLTLTGTKMGGITNQLENILNENRRIFGDLIIVNMRLKHFRIVIVSDANIKTSH